MSRRILIVLDSLGSGGAQSLFLNLAEFFIKKGYEVHIFVYSLGEDFFDSRAQDLGIKLVRVGKKEKGFSFLILFSLMRLIRREKYKRIFAVMHNPSIYASLARIFFVGSKLTICEVSSSFAKISQLRRMIFLVCANLATHVVVNSHSEASRLAKNIWNNNKVETIWNGYSLESFPFKSTDSAKLERIVVVARMHHAKNGLNLLKALDLFYLRNYFIPELLWVGRKETDRKSIIMQEKMEKFIFERQHLIGKIHFKGEVQDICRIYHSADALVSVSFYEGLPNVICEAMMCGTLVLASNIGDHSKILGNSGERGFCVSPESPEDICRGLETIYKLGKHDKKQLLDNAREFAIQNFDIQQTGKKFLNLSD